ncbi:MAG: HupE/UreJ family protein [Bryobacteraceae bacterium]
MKRTRAAFLIATAFLLPTAAQAHLVNTGLGPFYDGVSHLFLSPEDLLPVLALALLAGLRGSRTGRFALFALPGAWLAGGLAGLAFPAIAQFLPTHLALLSSVTFLALGALVALDVRLRSRLVTGIAIALGVVHGYVNGSAMSDGKLGALGLVGIATSIFVTVALAAGLVASLVRPWTRIAVRVAGSWIAAAGLLLLGWTLRPEAPRHQATSSAAHQQNTKAQFEVSYLHMNRRNGL